MKKYFMTVCAAVALLSCAKEINAPITTEGPANMEEQEIQPLVFDFQINHASMDDTATKAVGTQFSGTTANTAAANEYATAYLTSKIASLVHDGKDIGLATSKESKQ